MRESTNYPGDYTLCVSCEGKVEHYRIMYHSSKLSIDEEVYFENLMQLVEVRGGLYHPTRPCQPQCPHTPVTCPTVLPRGGAALMAATHKLQATRWG